MKSNNRRPSGNIMMRLAAVLFCLVMFSTYLMGGLYARYVTRGSGSDSARVAKFGDLTLMESAAPYESNTWRIIPGVDLQKDATISFDESEVAVYIFVQMELSDHWQVSDDKKTVTLSLGNTNVLTWQVADGWTHLKDNVYYLHLAPNTALDQDILAEDGKITVNENVTKAQMAQLRGLTDNIFIAFQANVIQSGEFASAEAAWEYLNHE